MAANDYIVNIDTSTTDSVGNHLIGSNEVLAVFYYDATMSGTEETWEKEWAIDNNIVNADFSSTITGTWPYYSDDVMPPYTFSISRFAGWHNTDLLRSKTVTSSGYSGGDGLPSYLVDYYSKYGWRTATADGNGAFAVTVDMGSDKDVNYVCIFPGWGTDTLTYLKGYRIGVATTDTELAYTIVASGVTTSGVSSSVVSYIGEQTARYVKLYVDSNWGSPSSTMVHKFSAFNDPDWSLMGHSYYGISGGTYAELRQDVDLTDYDCLFFDAHAYMSNAYQVGEVTIKIDDDVAKTYNWSNTGIGWLDANDENHWTRWEEKIDTSSYSGSHTIKVRMWDSGTYGRVSFMGYLDSISTRPRWAMEDKSSTRGATSAFPNEVYIVADRDGLSLIDKSDTSLWMRFDIGPGYMLEASAREIYANEGKIYLATSRGLVIIDFIENKAWKYSEAGLQYRMSIGKRNEYGFWFTHDASLALPSNDVYALCLGARSTGTVFVLVGTGYGLAYVEEGTVVRSSVFKYPIRKVMVYGSKAYYIGGFDSSSRLGVFEDFSVFDTTNFVEPVMMYSNDRIMLSDMLSGGFRDQWAITDGDLPITFNSGVLTISGTKTDVGKTVIIQETATPSRSFEATIVVKIKDWVDRTEGSFNFGLCGGYPYMTDLYEDGNNAYMLSAANGIHGQYVENESFSSYPSRQWVSSFYDTQNQTLECSDGALKISGYFSGFYGTSYSPMCGIGAAKRYPSCPSFTAKVKVKFTSMYSPPTGRVAGIVFGMTDGQYLGEGSTNQGLCVGIRSRDIDPSPVYCTATKTSTNGWTWDTTISGAKFSTDGTSNASYHTWEFTYNSSAKTLNGAIDGNYVGEVANVAMSSNVGIVMGPVGNYASGYIEAYFKDFEIEFPEMPGNQKEKYIVQKYESGVWSRPTVSGTHLSGNKFDADDGTPLADWHTWRISWDKTSFRGYVDDNIVSSISSSDVGEQPRIFISYDFPSTVSGSAGVEINIRDFTILYNNDDTVVSGTPNNIYPSSGTYDSSSYNALYLATASGVNHLMYLSGTTVSGAPDVQNSYGIATSNLKYPILYGNMEGCSDVESSSVGPTGVLYTGTSRYFHRGWERIKDRAGSVDPNYPYRISLGINRPGTVLFLSTNPNSDYHKIYRKELGVRGEDWKVIGAGSQTSGFQGVGDSRVYMNEISDDGVLICVGPTWLGRYDYTNEAWLGVDTNLGDGPISTGGGVFDEGEAAAMVACNKLFLAYNGSCGIFDGDLNNWWGSKYYYGAGLPKTTSVPCSVYSEVDNSIYMLQYGDSGNFFRMPLSSLGWSGALADCPIEYDFTKGISGFYRPYDECVYFLMKGSTDSYGRKLVRYDVKSGGWSLWGIDFPYTMDDYSHGVYSSLDDTLYVITGQLNYRMYRYRFPKDVAPRYIYWSGDSAVLPENSLTARFNKVNLVSGYRIGSDTFGDSTKDPMWFDYEMSATPTITNISESGDHLNFYVGTTATNQYCIRSQSVPLPPCDFTATLKVRIKDMRYSSGGEHNTVLFGVSDHFGSPGWEAQSTGASTMGNTMLGVDGLWMTAYNNTTTTNRYSMMKREYGVDTWYGSSYYQPFAAGDGTVGGSTYRNWKVDYYHPTRTITSYIDDVLIGTATLAGDGMKHGIMLSIGTYVGTNCVSGTVDVDVKDFDISCNSESSMSSNTLRIDDDDAYGYVYYEKYDSTIVSGTGYAYESDFRIDTYSYISSVYINTIGAVEDGNKVAMLNALYSGGKKIGVYTGGDPCLSSSYAGLISYDWTDRTTYKVVSDCDYVRVYLNGSENPSISVDYDSLPDSTLHRVRFGTLNPDQGKIVNVAEKNGHILTVSGSWTYETSAAAEESYYGNHYRKQNGSVSDAVIFRFNDTKGSSDLYVFYKAQPGNNTSAPFTVYHEGMVTLPIPDSYATNPINSVSDNINEGGGTDPNTTTVFVNQQRLASGELYKAANYLPSGYVYIGTYIDVNRVVTTCRNNSGTYVTADTVILKHASEQPRSMSSYRVFSVGYTVGGLVVYKDSDFDGAFSVVDLETQTLLDAYNDSTPPAIADGNISCFDVPM